MDAELLLRRAIAIASPSGQEGPLAAFLVEAMQGFCDESFVDPAGNAIGKLGSGNQQVYFLGHIDTVRGEIPVRLEEGKLYGRGSVDAKGSFCTAVAAASALSPEVLKRISLTLIGAVEEEAPTSKGARYALAHYPKPDLLIIGEPSNWDAITLGYKGRLIAKLVLVKENFHSAGDDSTAAEDMVSTWNQLLTWVEQDNQDITAMFERLQVSLQDIASSNDGMVQQASATIGFRLPLRWTPAALQKALAPFSAITEVSFASQEIAYRSPRDTVLSRAFRIAIREQDGKPRFKVKTGTSDMNVVAPHWDVPMLAYGPGDSALDHTPHEHLDIAEYKKAIAVLKGALEKL